jgi:hypothetical protein
MATSLFSPLVFFICFLQVVALLVLARRGEGVQGKFLPTAVKRRIRKKRGNEGNEGKTLEEAVKKVGRYGRKEE